MTIKNIYPDFTPLNMATEELSKSEASDNIEEVFQEIEEAVILDREFLESAMVGILSRGHVLLEDVPGTGKTLTAQSLADTLGLSFSRIQFTPDLLPDDVTGTHIFNEQSREFEFQPGPIFANIVLADEINRAPPKTQAALLEAMEEGQVSIQGETRQLPEPFFVLATQNPVEQEGTFPLPEAQVDRFNVKSAIGFPPVEGRTELLRRRAGRVEQAPSVDRVLTEDEVNALLNVPERTTVDDDVLAYISEISHATDEDNRVEVGISPRGTQRFFECARAYAVINGREYVTPDDVQTVAVPAQAHRLVLTAEAQVNDIDKATIIEDILEEIPVPTVE